MVNRNDERHKQALTLIIISIIVELLIRSFKGGDLLPRRGSDGQRRLPVPQRHSFTGQRRQVLLEFITLKDGPRLSLVGIGNSNRRACDLKGKHQLSCSSLLDRKSTRLNSSHANISYAVFCLKK